MITLDGVLQSPRTPQEETENGFKFGGWVAPFEDEEFSKAMKKEFKPAEYLLGRKPFEIWENYWPNHADSWPVINVGTKYVVSNTRKKTDWKNTVFLKNLDEIKKMKNSEGGDLQVWGSGKLIQLLLANDLVEELWLKIHPITLGDGKKLFENGTFPKTFASIESSVTPSGVILVNYKKAGKVETCSGGF